MKSEFHLMFTVFAANASVCIDKGLTVQDCADINKQAAISMFGFSNEGAEIAVSKWIQACKSNGVLK